MTPLTKALLSKCEFEVDTICSRPAKWLKYNAAAKNENARLMPLILALAECVEALESSLYEWDRETVGCQKCKEALERLKGVVGG